jgi:molybdopterin converting factor small subunit
MNIKVKLYATLRQYIENAADITKPEGIEVPEAATVEDIVKTLRLPGNLKVLALINGTHCREQDTTLKAGDTLLIYPLMSGG